MSNGFALSMRLLPLLVGLRRELNNAAPSLRSHYRTFITITGCSVPVPRIGTLALMGASHLSFSLCIVATGTHVPSHTPAQSHAASMPDVIRAAIRLPPDSSQGNDISPV